MTGGTRPWAIGLVAFCTLLTAGGQLLFKMGMNRFELTLFGLITNWPLILGFLFYGLGAVLLVIALKYGELSVLYPVVSLSYIWVAILSSMSLGETIGWVRIGGIACVILGVSAIGKGSNHTKKKLKLR
ncbi:EamA family transporter [Candidatus Woesearchaeota archaeon]|nr:EamA family transporter [Candidatus Woesearchaeota archaeon]